MKETHPLIIKITAHLPSNDPSGKGGVRNRARVSPFVGLRVYLSIPGCPFVYLLLCWSCANSVEITKKKCTDTQMFAILNSGTCR